MISDINYFNFLIISICIHFGFRERLNPLKTVNDVVETADFDSLIIHEIPQNSIVDWTDEHQVNDSNLQRCT